MYLNQFLSVFSMISHKFNLDHFYSSFSEPQFNSLKVLVDIFKNTKYLNIEREDLSYEGIYIRTLHGHYIELLNDKSIHNQRVNCIGVNSFSSPIIELSKLKSLVKVELDWRRSEAAIKYPDSRKSKGNKRSTEDDIGKDWFYFWSISNDSEEFPLMFFMDYAQQKFNKLLDYKTNIEKDFDFKQVNNVIWSLEDSSYEKMKINATSVAEDVIIEKNTLKLACPTIKMSLP